MANIQPTRKMKRSDKPATISTLLHAGYVTQQQNDEEQSGKQQSQQQPSSKVDAPLPTNIQGTTQQQQLSKEAMLQMMNRGQGWHMPNFGMLPGSFSQVCTL